MYRYKFTDKAEMEAYLKENLLNTEEARVFLGFSKQYFSDLTVAKKIIPAISHNKYKLFWKDDILAFQLKREEKKKKKGE